MGYTNSSLVDVIQISPNQSGPRIHKIDTVTIHCTAGQTTARALGQWFASANRKASSNYGIGYDGSIGLYVEEKDRSWCSSSSANDNRAITIEVSSDNYPPYKITSAAHKALIDLLVDICKRNSIEKLLWRGDKSLIGQVDKQNMTVHRWFANKPCPGDYLYNLHPQIAAEVNARLEDEEVNIDKFIEEASDEQLIGLFNKMNAALAKRELPTNWNARGELDEAVAMGITDGSRPMAVSMRYEDAIMIKRAAKK